MRKANHIGTSLIAILSLLLSSCATTGMSEREPVQYDPDFPPSLVELNFQSHGKRLNGILYQANGQGPHPTVVLLHGYPGNEKNLDLAQSMRRAGYNVLFFHYRGAWGSDGDFSFSHVIEDVASALSYARANAEKGRVDPDRLLLVGHSMGGFAALQGAANDDAIKCVAGIAPANTGLLAKAAAANPEIGQGFAAGADKLTMLNGWNGKAALADLAANADGFDTVALAPKLARKSVLLIAGEQDKVLTPDIHHTPVVAAYESQGDIDLTHSILPGDHSFSWSRVELIDTVLNWAKTCENSS